MLNYNPERLHGHPARGVQSCLEAIALGGLAQTVPETSHLSPATLALLQVFKHTTSLPPPWPYAEYAFLTGLLWFTLFLAIKHNHFLSCVLLSQFLTPPP